MWYVNCETTENFVSVTGGFILTMWYVNGVDAGNNISGLIRFILTMWYVNFVLFYNAGIEDTTFYINYVICKF